MTIIYTPASNILKRGDFATGAVSFHNDRKVKRFRIEERVNAIVNRLKCVPSAALLSRADSDQLAHCRLNVRSKTKVERQVDHEAEKIAYESAQQRLKREAANKHKNAELLLARQRKAEAEARSYDKLFSGQSGKADDQWEEDQWEASRKEGDVRSSHSPTRGWGPS